MKKWLSAFSLVTCLGFGISTPSLALESLSCKIYYKMKGGGFQLLLGYFKLTGLGEVSCVDMHGTKMIRDVKVTLGGSPFAPACRVGWMHMKGISGSFGISGGSIDSVYGHYLSTGVHAAVGLGAGSNLSFQNPINRVSVNLGGEVSVGLGFTVGTSMFTIEPIIDPDSDSCHSDDDDDDEQ